MQFDLAHSALEPGQEPVVEQRRMINAVGVADQRVGEAAQINEAVPVSLLRARRGTSSPSTRPT
jgi:hypothetical protein